MLDLMFLRRCAACDTPFSDLVCLRCAPRVAARVADPTGWVAAAWALGAYETRLGRALRRAKYGPDRAVGAALAAHTVRAVAPCLPAIDAIVPVPTPPLRRWQRGYALPDLLADQLAAAIRVPVLRCVQIARGPRQAEIGDAAARRRNLRGRVRCETPLAGRVLLVDDVLTTGTTAGSCARELLGAGARDVLLTVICAARDPSERA